LNKPNLKNEGILLNYSKLGLIVLIAALLLVGCTSPSQAPGTDRTPGSAAGSVIKGTLDTNEKFSATLSYNPITKEASIEAWQYLDEKNSEQLPFACAIGSSFLLLINNATIYGESGRVNGTYQVRVPWAKYEQFVKGSGLSKQEFDAMNVTTVTIRYKSRETEAAMGECVQNRGQKITLDGEILDSDRITESGKSGIRQKDTQPA